LQVEEHGSASVDALAAGSSPLIGRYRYGAEGWTWSDELYVIHGFAPGEVVPSSELMVAHHDPDDVVEAREAFKAALTSGEPYSSYHHIIDNRHRRRKVLVVGRGTMAADGTVSEMHGFVIDLTDATRTERQAEITAAIEGVLEHRGIIEQAKGILMLALGVGADPAFQVLRAHSQDGNVKLHDVAARLVEVVVDGDLARDDTRGRVLEALDRLTP
jgi:ANTAR domain/PAS fold